jgi:hypothetical protein
MDDVLAKLHECNQQVVLTVKHGRLVYGARCKP